MTFEIVSPVFIIGCPRSGTTMVASQLANAVNAIALPEMQYIYPLLHMDGGEVEAAYWRLRHDFRFQVSNISMTFDEFSAAATNGGKAVIMKIIENYARDNKVVIDTSLPVRWIEHAPATRNNVTLVSRAFPDAKFIHIVRDPRSTYLSMRNLERWDIWDPLKFNKIWGDAVGKCHRFARSAPDRVIEVRYEDMLVAPEQTLSQLCSFLDLNYDAAMLGGGGVRLPQFTQSQHALTLSGARKDKLDDWKTKIERREAELIEVELADWMIHFDYLEAPRDLVAATGKEKLRFGLRRAMKSAGAKVRDLKVRTVTAHQARNKLT